MMISVLEGCLLKEHRDKGMELYEPDDHLLVLRCKGEVIATYSQDGVKVSEIRKDATEYLAQRR